MATFWVDVRYAVRQWRGAPGHTAALDGLVLGVSARDPLVYAAAALLLLSCAGAVAISAARAMHGDP